MKNIKKINHSLRCVVLASLALIAVNSYVFETYAASLTDEEQIIVSAGGDINKIPVRQEPGPDAETIVQTVHSKTVQVLGRDVSFKWTMLGYQVMTPKVIIPDLVHHTVFNHRNDGEDGPCLRTDNLKFGWPIEDSLNTFADDSLVFIEVKIINQFIIDRSKNICKVQMVEDVRTTINGSEFYHRLVKDMGFRFIEDCPAK